MTTEATVEAEFEAHGLVCKVRRTSVGVLCGYVQLPEGHPWEAAENEWDEPVCDVEVHGGVTWCSKFLPNENAGPNLWVGFDTAHHGDYIPFSSFGGGKRWSVDEVKAETMSLARQAKEALS